MSADLEGTRPLALVAAGSKHLEPAGTRQRDQCGRDSAAGALHEHRVAGLQVALDEEHAIGRQPRRRQAGGLLEAHRSRFGDHVGPRHDDLVGEGALVPLGEQRALGIERLVTAPVGAADDCVHDDLVAVLVEPGRVAAENHRQSLVLEPHPAQRPQVVVVEACRLDGDRRPAVGGHRVGSLADHEGGQRVVGGEGFGVHGEHATHRIEVIAWRLAYPRRWKVTLPWGRWVVS